MDDVQEAEVTSTVTSTAAPVTSTAIQKTEVKPSATALKDLGAMQFAQMCVASGLFKDTTDVAKAAVKMKFGYALGIDEATALSSIILVQGRMSFTANFIAARVRQSGKYRYKVLEKSDKKCRLQFFEKVEKWDKGQLIFEWQEPGPPEEFNMEMAKRAGLTKNETWSKYPEAMCFARCLTAGARTYCSDVFLGNAVYTPDELDPNLPVTLNDQGEMVVAETEVKKTRATAPKVTPSISSTPSEMIERIQKLAKETGSDLKPYSALYGVTDMNKLSAEQLVDFERKLQQKKAGATTST